MQIDIIPSPNFGSRNSYKPIAFVVHIAQAPSLKSIDNTFKNKSSQSSSHYAIDKDTKTIHGYVGEALAAWHTGIKLTDPKPTWKLYKSGVNPNWYTIGCENVGFSVPVTYENPITKEKVTYQPTQFTEWQYFANSWLAAKAAKTWGFPINEYTIIRHGDIYVPKKDLCPGPQVDMKRIIEGAKVEFSKL